ncbi:hypothetical protein [Clostridium sp. BNL1100]|uniref:hypothetical protein n=1 Tax=Clostridium sp. BNL1100 TaxID=755731 RepID=UPI00024A75A9|nr:hypothetical protein [Clostridium sp. BNL1100]AEY65553.1 hypothetical protein Clo1100_1311 [Clostridium sp. BNL1100]
MFNYDTERQGIPHPIIVEARQIASNRILMTYDQRTDLDSATNVSNYWIRSNMGTVGIASVGMKEALTANNAIRPDMAGITPADNSRMRYIMTFRVNAMSGIMYTVLPCFVNLEGMTGFRGENWSTFSRNMFIGM